MAAEVAAVTEVSVKVQQGKFSATLIAGGFRPGLNWMFPGPDQRYRYGHAHVPVRELKDLDEAVVVGFEQWLSLSQIAPAGTQVNKHVVIAGRGLQLQVGGYLAGLQPFPAAEHAYQCVITDEGDLQDFRALLATAASKATALQALLQAQ